MANSIKKSLYDVALDGQGFVLVGDPLRPRIRSEQQPIFGNRFAQGDRDFQDLSLWWYAAIRDFTAGIKELDTFADDGKFYTGKDLDSFSVPGECSQIPVMATVEDFGTTDFLAVNHGAFDIIGGVAQILQGVQGLDVTKKSKIYKSTDGLTYADVTAAGSPTDGKSWKHIKKISLFGNFYIARNDSSWAMSTFDGTTHADVTATIQGADSLTVADGFAEAGGRAWAFFRDGVSPANLIIKSSVSAATWTKRVTLPGAFFLGGIEQNGDLVYLVDYGFNTVELRRYDISADVDALVYRWVGRAVTLGTAREVRGGAIETLDNQNAYIILDGGEIWKYDGSSVERVFRNSSSQIGSIGFGLVRHDGYLYGPNVVIAPDGSIHAGPYSTTSGTANKSWPMYSAKFTGDTVPLLYVRDDGSAAARVRISQLTSGGSAFIELDAIDGALPNIDKLWSEVTLLFAPFNNANQSFNVSYKADTATSYTALGTISQTVDGNISSKMIRFPDTLVSKKLSIKVELANTGTFAQRPKLKAVLVRYLPVPHYRHRWTFTVNCADNILLKDSSTKEVKSGEWLRNYLRNAWWKRQVLSFEDLDGETLTLTGALTSSATTIPVDERTDNLPEIGRIKIDDEEIQYGGKSKGSFLTCTRGARGTFAAAHNDDAAVSTAYDAIIVGYSEEVPISNQPNKREYRVQITLLEV